MSPSATNPTDADADPIDEGGDRLDAIEDRIDEGRDALGDHEPVDGDDADDEHTFIQDGSIHTEVVDDAIRPAS